MQDLDKMHRIPSQRVVEFLEHLGNTMFSVVFTKKDGTERKMVCRLHVTKGVKGTGRNNAADFNNPYMTVYDMQRHDFRNVNLTTLKSIKTHGVTLEVG